MTIRHAANAAVKLAIDEALAAGHEVGVQVAAYLRGELVVDAWGGVADPATGRPVDGDTLFNVYSVTKAVAATAIHMMVEMRPRCVAWCRTWRTARPSVT